MKMRRPPFTPAIAGLVRAPDRLARVRAPGTGGLDLPDVPAARVVALARYAGQARATQLADLAPQRRIATLVACTRLLAASARDDVTGIFDVVFGDLQRAATHRGQKRRAGELRDYDQAVAAVHAHMRSLLDALDDPPALEEVLAALRVQREGIEANMGTVGALMRPPGDPFHKRLVAACPQIRRFLPTLIKALELQAIDSAAPVLDACHALGQWLAGKPRTTRRPASEVPLGVVTPSWRPHVHDQDSDTVDRAACTCCVLDQVRTRLRRDICAPGSTRWDDPRAELLTPRDWVWLMAWVGMVAGAPLECRLLPSGCGARHGLARGLRTGSYSEGWGQVTRHGFRVRPGARCVSACCAARPGCTVTCRQVSARCSRWPPGSLPGRSGRTPLATGRQAAAW